MSTTQTANSFYRVDMALDDGSIISRVGAFHSGSAAVDYLFTEGELYDWAEITADEYSAAQARGEQG